MKRTFFLIAIACACVCSCAEKASEIKNEKEYRFFTSWVRVNYPNAEKTFPGIYIVEDIPGSGDIVGDPVDSTFLEADYSIRTVEKGEYAAFTYAEVAKQLSQYDKTRHYGPSLMPYGSAGTYAGAEYAFRDMRVGGFRKIIIPRWMMNLSRYDSEEGYLRNVNGQEDYIYEIKILDKISDEPAWEVDSIQRYIRRNYDESTVKQLKYGFYYIRTKEPSDTTSFKKDSTFYINYIGRRLDGQVFDTTIKDTARMYGIFKEGNAYKPVKITYADDYTEIKLSGNNVIDGFAYAIYQMKPYESCTAIFYSASGYSSSGSGAMIPEYSPLRFDISIVDEK